MWASCECSCCSVDGWTLVRQSSTLALPLVFRTHTRSEYTPCIQAVLDASWRLCCFGCFNVCPWLPFQPVILHCMFVAGPTCELRAASSRKPVAEERAEASRSKLMVESVGPYKNHTPRVWGQQTICSCSVCANVQLYFILVWVISCLVLAKHMGSDRPVTDDFWINL